MSPNKRCPIARPTVGKIFRIAVIFSAFQDYD